MVLAYGAYLLRRELLTDGKRIHLNDGVLTLNDNLIGLWKSLSYQGGKLTLLWEII